MTSLGTLPSYYEQYIIPLQSYRNIKRAEATNMWKQCVANIPWQECDGTPHYLAFVWANTSINAKQPGAIIDNVEIVDSPICNVPNSLQTIQSGSSVLLTWDSGNMEHEVSAYSYETASWINPVIVYESQFTFHDLPAGQTDFIVRDKCGDGGYTPKAILSKLIYYPDEMCIDYLDLRNAVCYINHSSPKNTLTFDDFTPVAPVDYGPASVDSRHTVHFDRTETDVRTNNVAYVVPEDAFGAVRLGNWEGNNEAERMEFTMVVDTLSSPLLKLRYLPILEAPSHADYENPRFRMKVLVNGTTVDTCVKADFNANNIMYGSTLKPEAVEQGWHFVKEAGGIRDITWKDWTTVGVNLCKPEYEGKEVTIQLTTTDCAYSMHNGYVYFTLDCMDNKIKGELKENNRFEFNAPEGFVYQWYLASDGAPRRAPKLKPNDMILGHDRSFTVDVDDEELYAVDCMFVQDSSNYFTLYASVFSAQPVPVLDYKMDSLNMVDSTYSFFFDASNSYATVARLDMPDSVISISNIIDSVVWNFGDGITADTYYVDYKFKAPLVHDTTWVVSLTAYYQGYVQTDTVHITIAPIPNTEDITQIKEDILALPSIVKTAEQISVLIDEPSQIRFYNMMGICNTYAIGTAGEVPLTMPSVPGIYVAEIVSCSGKRSAKQMIVQ